MYTCLHTSSNHDAINPPSTNKRNRQRDIIWFKPSSKSVKSNIARNFLHLINKHFPKTSALHKIFNRNTVKVSYSCVPNLKSTISRHNKQILSTCQTPPPHQQNCNCRNSEDCPLNKNCQYKCIIYKAEVTTSDGKTKEYIGMTANSYKKRYYNHKTIKQLLNSVLAGYQPSASADNTNLCLHNSSYPA